MEMRNKEKRGKMKRVSLIVGASLLFNSAQIVGPSSAHAIVASIPLITLSAPLGVPLLFLGSGISFGLFPYAVSTLRNTNRELSWLPFTLYTGLAIAAIALDHPVSTPPLVRLPESLDFSKEQGLSLSEISEFNDSLEQVAAVDVEIMRKRSALHERLRQEASNSTQTTTENSIEITSLTEARQFFQSLGLDLNDENDQKELLSEELTENLVAKFSQQTGLNESAARVYLKTRLANR